MGYRMISYWLNEHGYKTTRGRTQKNTHVFSVLKKKKIANEESIRCINLKLKT